LLGFAIPAGIELYEIYTDQMSLNFIYNILSISCLTVYVYTNTPKDTTSKFSKYIQYTLLCSMLGSISLMVDTNFLKLMLKLGFAHFFFLISCVMNMLEIRGTQNLIIKQICAMPFFIFAAFVAIPFLDFLYAQNIQNYLFAFLALLGFSVTGAIFRYGFTTQKSFWLVFLGAVCQYLSECLTIAHQLYHFTRKTEEKKLTIDDLYVLLMIRGLFYMGDLAISVGVVEHAVTYPKLKGVGRPQPQRPQSQRPQPQQPRQHKHDDNCKHDHSNSHEEVRQRPVGNKLDQVD